MANPVLYPALAEAALISYRDIKNGTNVLNPVPHFPLPSQFASVLLIYGGLSLIPGRGQRVASLVGWGFVVATALNLWTPAGKVRKVSETINPTKGSTNV